MNRRGSDSFFFPRATSRFSLSSKASESEQAKTFAWLSPLIHLLPPLFLLSIHLSSLLSLSRDAHSSSLRLSRRKRGKNAGRRPSASDASSDDDADDALSFLTVVVFFCRRSRRQGGAPPLAAFRRRARRAQWRPGRGAGERKERETREAFFLV